MTAWLPSDEETLWTGQPRLVTVLPTAVVGGVLVALGAVLSVTQDEPLVLLLVPLGLALPLVDYLVVTHTQYAITDDAVYAYRGIFGRQLQRATLEKVQDTSFSQSIRGRFLGYGQVTVEVAGGEPLTFRAIEEPQVVRRHLDRGIRADDAVPGTTEEWEAVLREVRALRAAVEARGGLR